ncbi:MAG: YebC/PmpR family DNA-binding transcriptional regulator [Bacteroidetes bacterium]|nr:YebC/PmpR family DNA-binding transcriptional regulator [Bacteroidota bacterium]
MGRAFEFRRARKEKRWSKMAKDFVKMGKQLSQAVKSGGPDPETNPMLRVVIQNCKAINMPKDNIESAIKRASSKDEKALEELVYEGYGPHGVAVLIETATDNPTRTVANVRMYFNRSGGALGKTGSLDFLFDRKAVFTLESSGLDLEELELELIDFGLEEIFEEEGRIYIYTPFTDFGGMQHELEKRKLPIVSSELVRLPSTTVELTPEQEEEINSLVEKIEDDDDVQQVFTNMK